MAHPVLSKHFFSTTVKLQFAAKLQDVLDNTPFQRTYHSSKGRQAVF